MILIKENFAEKLREQRRINKLTQEQLALNSGIGYRFVQDLEAGLKQPTITTLFKLSKAFKITPDKLIMSAWLVWSDSEDD